MVAFDMDRSIRSSLWCRYLCNTNTSLPGTSADKIDKLRLDRLLVERGLVERRERGQAMRLRIPFNKDTRHTSVPLWNT